MALQFEEAEFQEAYKEIDEPQLEGGWELFTDISGIQIYRLYDKRTGLYKYKIIGGLANCTPELCADVYMDLKYRKSWDGYVKVFMNYFDNPGGSIPSWLINWAAKSTQMDILSSPTETSFSDSALCFFLRAECLRSSQTYRKPATTTPATANK
ncbi:UNVERIFIED_CONTAM: hypothetical protein FKN15_063124 [Acipenser sinensis]